METIVKKLAQSVEVPVMIDSTEPAVIAAARARTPAARSSTRSIWKRPANGSTTLMRSCARPRGRRCADDRRNRHGKNGRPESPKSEAHLRDRDHRVRFAARALIFDALTFTWRRVMRSSRFRGGDDRGHPAHQAPRSRACSPRSGEQRELRTEPQARAALNSVMLHHCVDAGLDHRDGLSPKRSRRMRRSMPSSAGCATIWSSIAGPMRSSFLSSTLRRRDPLLQPMRWPTTWRADRKCASTTRFCGRRKDGHRGEAR